MQLKLIVIRTPDPESLANFYSLLGLKFDYHKHGNSPYHYGTTIGETVLEIYPLAKGQTDPDKHLRLGLAVEDFDKTIETLKEKQVPFAAEPTQTEFGYLAIIIDPDGRKLELYKK
ncbi:VOC family protein [Paraflavitalea speifideaquila]|uniref:VOC family protein n=1 Tax=Paraflavitalea speifideaquila TaxID=3076558 RepID=UPI0028E7541E|nr:VOC family protein [Paraflavitalea speifideiaquila]